MIPEHNTPAKTPSDNSPWRNPWVIGWIVMILIVLGANGLMVWMAASTSPGLVTEAYYDHGSNYQETLKRREAVDALGVNAVISIPQEIRVGETAAIRTVGVDKAGLPLAADTVTLYGYRPSDSARDFNQPMSAERPGTYLAETRFPLPGIWDLIVSIETSGHRLDLPQRVHVLAR